jgi:GntR family transcriptional regulator/MocR family aminotransferase
MEPIFELAIVLPPKGSRSPARALHGQLRDAILDGRLLPGLRLPPTRALAGRLGVSRNTAVAAYDLLLAEGYLTSQQGDGTYVAKILPDRVTSRTAAGYGIADPRLAAAWRKPLAAMEAIPGTFRFDFRVGIPDQSLFPFDIWRRLSARALRNLSKTQPSYANPDGRPELREAIAAHVSFTRAVACRAGDIVVTAGAQRALDLLTRVLVTPGETVVAMENPGYTPARTAFAAGGAEIVPVPVDGEGLIVDSLPVSASLIYVTPSHQFPLGVALSARRRAALLDYAQKNRAVIIEDDYDGEFRFGGRPLDALQTLDRTGSVFYVGTFSKSLFPALRLGFAVVPGWARAAIITAKQIADGPDPVVTQDALAAFITEGHLARHVRKMRHIYSERRVALLEALERHCAGWLEPMPSLAGLHISARLAPAVKSASFAAQAAEAGIAVEPIGKYAASNPTLNGLAFGLGGIATGRIDEGIAWLARLKSLNS